LAGRLKKYLVTFFEQRTEDLINTLPLENIEYKHLQNTFSQKETLILGKLDLEGQKDFADLESLLSKMDEISRAKIYKQGFFDGMKASRLFHKM
jgi:hypothetical protein